MPLVVYKLESMARQPRQVGRLEIRSDRTIKTRMIYMEKFPVRMEVRLDEDMRDQLQEKVLKLGISTSAYIRMIISETLNPNT